MRLFRHASGGIPALVPIPPIAELPAAKMQASGRYLGTFDTDGQRVIGHSLAAKSAARLSLSAEALDVVRIAGSFRIRAETLRGARSAATFGGKAVDNLLVVRWTHEGLDWETGFRMDPARSVRDAAKAQMGRTKSTVRPEVDAWVRSISKISRGNA
ncbi:PH-like domain-containing protein [Marmoricola sp. RAF53]|uniref:PH-like domain-containing protein n=1 Tax=Marmoricola sp. RAF53 TaxID=3233059 RepID=UPI003F957C24